MNMSNRFVQYPLLVTALSLICICESVARAQSDVHRQTVAVTYPLDRTVNVKFRGTTRLPRLSGEAKVRRAGRRGTRVELSVKNLPRAYELGGIYTTYVLWAISPEGRVDNLGEIKRSGSFIVDSKLDVTTPQQTFALLVTAEPHFLVRGPSRMVVLENLPPSTAGGAEVSVVNVQYLGNTSDYFRDPKVPDVADLDYRKTPVSLLGARQAINLARYAGADNDAPDELREAQAQLESAENSWRLKQPESDIDAVSRRATSLGARAEEMAEARHAARQRRDEIARRDDAVRSAEESTAVATKQIADLRAALDKEQRARENSDRDLSNADQQLRDLRTENSRLRDELTSVRAESDEAKLKLARIEGERSAEDARKAGEQRVEQQRVAIANLKQSLGRYGAVRDTNRGVVVVLPESLWRGPRATDLTPAAAAKLDPLAALLANNPDYHIVIESYTDSRGDQAGLQQLTEERARALAGRFEAAGIDTGRIEATGMGAANPIATNARPAGRLRNRRIEVILQPIVKTPEPAAGRQ